jgi:hypothetical protein
MWSTWSGRNIFSKGILSLEMNSLRGVIIPSTSMSPNAARVVSQKSGGVPPWAMTLTRSREAWLGPLGESSKVTFGCSLV